MLSGKGKSRIEEYERRKTSAVDLYRRADMEVALWRGRVDGLSEEELSEMVGLPNRKVHGILERMLDRVKGESIIIARTWALRQTISLWSELYEPSIAMWLETKDPRYAEQARGCLSDIRRIWGVDAPQRLEMAAVIGHVDGVHNTALGDLTDAELEQLEGIFARFGPAEGDIGEELPESLSVCEVGNS